jgi:hypothetical protein
MVIILSILLIICVFIIFKLYNKVETIHKLNNDIDIQNKEKEIQSENLKAEIELLNKQCSTQQEQLKHIQENIQETTTNQKKLSQEAFQNYFEVLEQRYKEQEEEYEDEYSSFKEAIETAYSNLQLQLMREADECRNELEQLKKMRAAAIEANLREKKIKEDLSFYCLKLTDLELADVRMLEKIKPNLNKPRVLSMLIWSTFFQKQMNTLCANVLGTSTVTGVYKITNQQTNEVYIGQAVDIAARWKQHAKCGLGIDTPPANKLYKAMQEEGIWNFSWELLEACKSTELNKKEREYIEMYQSKEFGYNSNKGVKD